MNRFMMTLLNTWSVFFFFKSGTLNTNIWRPGVTPMTASQFVIQRAMTGDKGCNGTISQNTCKLHKNDFMLYSLCWLQVHFISVFRLHLTFANISNVYCVLCYKGKSTIGIQSKKKDITWMTKTHVLVSFYDDFFHMK